MQHSLAICLYYAKINRDRIKKPSIFRTSSPEILKYTITNYFKKTSHSYGVYYSRHSYVYFYRVINTIVFIPYICKDQYQYALEIRIIDCNLQHGNSITQYQSFDINGLICIFNKVVRGFRDNYFDLLFEHQDIGISISTSFLICSYSSFKLRQSDSIDFGISFFPKLCFSEQQIPKR